MAKWNRRKGGTVVLAAGLAAMTLAALLAAVAAARPAAGFLHILSNLSQESDRTSAHPNLAVSADGNLVVAVWTERYNPFAEFRGRVYLRVASETDGGWGDTITVFPDGSETQPDITHNTEGIASVAVAGTTAHVAYVARVLDAGIDLTRTEVRYRTCSLTSGQCGDWESVFAEDNVAYFVGRVDIALDGDGDPHVVWARYDQDKTNRDIMYNTRSEGVWSEEEDVDSGGLATSIESAPAIACEGGYVYVVWEGLSEGKYWIWYRRRDASDWGAAGTMMENTAGNPSGNPDVVAGAGRVFVVWDWCPPSYPDECSWYHLLYSRSDVTDTVEFDDRREVGTDEEASSEWKNYYSANDQSGQDSYLWDLQPSVALNDAGWPTVVWHARGGEPGTENAIYYSYAITGTDTGVTWITSTILSWNQAAASGSAAIGIGELAADSKQHPHIVYMQKSSGSAWDVYYNSDEWEYYPHVFMPLIMRGAQGMRQK